MIVADDEDDLQVGQPRQRGLQRSNPFDAGNERHGAAVAALEQKGLKNAHSVDEVETGTMFVRAHGLPVGVLDRAKERGLTVIDATCPMVTKIHVQAEKLRNDGYKIVVVGDANHPEVKGTLSHVSPLARALFGKAAGDVVGFAGGDIEILAIK